MESVSKPYEFIVLRPNVYSLHFEEKHNYALHQMVQLFNQYIPELLEVTNTFNRINLFTPENFSSATLLNRLNEIDISSCLNFSSSQIWELPICFDTSFTTDLYEVFCGNQGKIDAYHKVQVLNGTLFARKRRNEVHAVRLRCDISDRYILRAQA